MGIKKFNLSLIVCLDLTTIRNVSFLKILSLLPSNFTNLKIFQNQIFASLQLRKIKLFVLNGIMTIYMPLLKINIVFLTEIRSYGHYHLFVIIRDNSKIIFNWNLWLWVIRWFVRLITFKILVKILFLYKC